jgi:hypothetical protein
VVNPNSHAIGRVPLPFDLGYDLAPMDTIRAFLFESPLFVLGVSVVALVIALAAHRRGHVQGARRALLITVGATAGLLLLQTLVVTDREALEALVVQLADNADEGDVAAIGTQVDPAGVELGSGQSAKHCTKAGFLSACNVGLQRYRIDKPSVGAIRVEIAGPEATVSFRVTCDIQQGQASEWRMPSFWTVGCVKGPEGWKLRQISKAQMGIEGFASSLDILPYLREFWSVGMQDSLP